MGSSIYLQRSSTEDLRDFIAAVAAVEIFMLLFFMECKVYDLSTALFFAIALGLLARGKFREYSLLFPLACLNRETTILLTLFFMVYYSGRVQRKDSIAGVVYQGFMFMAIRLWLMVAFADNAGMPFLFQPLANIAEHLKYPGWSLLFLAAVLGILWMCTRGWRAKPIFLRSAFVVLVPALVGLYLLFGVAFEIRVFAEVYPVAFVLAVWSYLK